MTRLTWSSLLIMALPAPSVSFLRSPGYRACSTPKVFRRNEFLAAAAAEELPHVVVVGAGWAGWGAAKCLLESGTRVTLIDTQADPTGATPMLSDSGKPVEPGTRGFWKDYPNIESCMAQLGLDEDNLFTPFTNSSFYSPDGLEATAPVFSSSALPQLPSPLGQVVIADQLLMLGSNGVLHSIQGGPRYDTGARDLSPLRAPAPVRPRLHGRAPAGDG